MGPGGSESPLTYNMKTIAGLLQKIKLHQRLDPDILHKIHYHSWGYVNYFGAPSRRASFMRLCQPFPVAL